jgi:hypothetical protein
MIGERHAGRYDLKQKKEHIVTREHMISASGKSVPPGCRLNQKKGRANQTGGHRNACPNGFFITASLWDQITDRARPRRDKVDDACYSTVQ